MKDSGSGFRLPIRIPLIHSKYLFQWLIVVHVLLALYLFVCPLNIAKWPFFLLLILSAVRYAVIYKNRIFPLYSRLLLLDEHDNWFVVTETGERLGAKIISPSFVHPLLLALSFKVEKQKLNVILLKDNIQTDTFRRLRVRLRFPV